MVSDFAIPHAGQVMTDCTIIPVQPLGVEG
jgi:hypothetical protein